MALLSARRWAIAASLVLAAAAQADPQARDDRVQMMEHKLKAGLLYNFLKYTDWPDEPEGPASVCVFGDDPFAGALDPIATRTVKQRPISLRRPVAVAEVSGCDLVFVSQSERARWPQLRDSLAGSSVLTVSDQHGFVQAGGMVEFGRKGARIDVIVDLAAVRRARLHVDDRLMKLAREAGE